MTAHTPTVGFGQRPAGFGTGFATRMKAAAAAALKNWQESRRKARDMYRLSIMTDRELADIGLTRDDVAIIRRDR